MAMFQCSGCVFYSLLSLVSPPVWCFQCRVSVIAHSMHEVVHAAQATKYRMWWLLPTAVLAGIGEVVGWSGRYWSTRDMEADGFLMQ
jgi:hypothetical protein